MAIQKYGAFLDGYSEEKNFVNNHLLRIKDDKPAWEDNTHDLNWFNKVWRWIRGGYRLSQVTPFLVEMGRTLAHSYEIEKDQVIRAELKAYLKKCAHLTKHFENDVIDVHNKRRIIGFNKRDLSSLIESLKALFHRPYTDKDLNNFKGRFQVKGDFTTDVTILILQHLGINSIARLKKANRAWYAFITAHSNRIPAIRWQPLFSRLLSYRPDPVLRLYPFNSICPITFDTFMGTNLTTDGLSVDFSGLATHHKIGSENTLREVYRLNDHEIILKGHHQLVIYDVKQNKAKTVGEFVGYVWYELKVFNDREFLGVRLHSFAPKTYLYLLNDEGNETRLFKSQTDISNSYFLFNENTCCFVCDNLHAEVISLGNKRSSSLEDLYPSFKFLGHNGHYVILENTATHAVGFWSLLDRTKVKEISIEFTSFTMFKPIDDKTFAGIKVVDKTTSLVLVRIDENEIKDLQFPLDSKIFDVEVGAYSSYLLRVEDTLNRSKSLYSWSEDQKEPTLLQPSNGHLEKIGSDLWMIKNGVVGTPVTAKFIKYSKEKTAPEVIDYPLPLHDASYNETALLLTHFNKKLPQLILKV